LLKPHDKNQNKPPKQPQPLIDCLSRCFAPFNPLLSKKSKVKHLLKSTEQRLQAKMIPTTQPNDLPNNKTIRIEIHKSFEGKITQLIEGLRKKRAFPS
jgi:hypothetical protein